MTLGRREFVTLLGGAAAWPLAARAQRPGKLPTIGYLSGASANSDLIQRTLGAFRQGLAEIGFFENRNFTIEYRWAENEYGRLPALAAELLRDQVAVIVSTGGVPVTLAAKAATTTVPVVFATGADPVRLGLVASLNRPGGNLTGAANLNGELLPKRLELLHEIAPSAAQIALLVNPSNSSTETQLRDAQAAARKLAVRLDVLHASAERDFEAVFESLARSQAGGLVIGGDGVFVNGSETLGRLALHHRVPAIFQYSQFTRAGGLMSYSSSLADNYRVIGLYVGRILKGEKPADLPVYETTSVELIINMKTAKILGISVPLTLLGRADEVIE
jgi:putative ABC transport system substrate-binding protein